MFVEAEDRQRHRQPRHSAVNDLVRWRIAAKAPKIVPSALPLDDPVKAYLGHNASLAMFREVTLEKSKPVAGTSK